MQSNRDDLSKSLSSFQFKVNRNVDTVVATSLKMTVLQPWKLAGMQQVWGPLATQYGIDLIRDVFGT